MRTRILVILISGLVVGGALGIIVGGVNLPADSADNQERLFSVRNGEGTFEIASNLEREGLVRSRLFFDAAVIFLGGVKYLQAGDYYLSADMTPSEMAQKIIDGETAKETITIPEGWSLVEISSYLKKKDLFKKEEFSVAIDQDFSQEFLFLKDRPPGADLEGYLFPDTYEIQRGEEAEILIKKMLANFDQKLTPELRTEIKRQQKSVFEIVVMASLLEKEVKTLEDKKLVAGILWKRLATGMRLQVDATIVYALGIKPGQVTYEDTRIDSPYNTYRLAGLPLGPIANPGLDSLFAAVYPQKNDYWYYLSAADGRTLYSKTLEEHNLKKAKYLK